MTTTTLAFDFSFNSSGTASIPTAVSAQDNDILPAEEVEVEDLYATEPGSPAEARAAFLEVAGEIAQLRKLSLVNLEQKHLELRGVASAVRSRDALIKQISLALQRRATNSQHTRCRDILPADWQLPPKAVKQRKGTR